jgi:UDP-glucose 4-epimerase
MMPMNVLLTGGAGYIGSHMARVLSRPGHRVVAYDSLVKGHRASLDLPLVVGDVADGAALAAALRKHEIDTVIHLAAFIEAGESVENPHKYFANNTVIGLSLLEAMRECGVQRMVFSSTAAVYGQPKTVPITEEAELAPINPYGASKLCVEYMLRAYAAAYGMGFVALRYFNVAGADPEGAIGEDHHPETHLIPLVLQAALGKRDRVRVYGQDYPTPDGTCIRDYIHVCDLCEAHRLAAAAIEPGACKAYNLGSGEGFSVKEVIDACRDVTGRPIVAEPAPRRPGDPPRLVASSRKAETELGWHRRYSDLKTIVAHAWKWHLNRPEGYGD